MQQYPLIFSDEKKYRIRRHLLFWTFWWVFFGILYAFVPVRYPVPAFQKLVSSFADALCYLPAHMFLSYSLMYWVIPRLLLKGKYLITAAAVIILFILAGCFSAFISNFIIAPARLFLFGNELMMPAKSPFFLSLLAGLRGGITIGGIAAAIKLMKHLYMKEQKNMLLQKENIDSQLQLLKAQVHPHFLFNTLNNLYSLTLSGSEKAPLVVTHLSNLLRYILYECNEKEVPLSKEIEVIKQYIELEKLRYGNRIDISFKNSGNIDELKIAPLLLLPFIENSFKHGVSEQLEQCWINLHLHTGSNKLSFHLTNSNSGINIAEKGGIGLQNIQKRLDLLYADKYNLTIKNDEDMYLVKLELELNTAVIIPQLNPVANLQLQPAL